MLCQIVLKFDSWCDMGVPQCVELWKSTPDQIQDSRLLQNL